jgi:CheY-like chemotaxis protein
LLERLELNRIVEDVVAMLKPTFPKTIDVQLDLSKEIPSISADTNQMSQILLNLCVNAKDAMPNGGTIRFKTTLISGDEVRSLFVEASKDTEYVCLEMSDTGSGMDENVRSRIFEPFFTTKEPGKGTGLGLSVVYGVVKGHRGFIDVHSTIGLGTTFVVYLPCRENSAVSDKAGHDEGREDFGGSETILLVEDEEDILLAVKDILQESGYKVLTARDGEEAVVVFERNKEEIALLLSDLGLPKLSGLDAFVQMAIFDPGLKAILASGNLDVGKKSEMLRAGVKRFVQKPYEAEAILRNVREVISEN